MSALRHAPVLGRRALLALVGLVLAAAIVVTFSGTLTRSTDVEARAEKARAEMEMLQAQVEAGEAELVFVQGDDFVRWQARVYGFGEKGEKLFSLADGAPAPKPVVPIGPQRAEDAPLAPFEAWMELLFGV